MVSSTKKLTALAFFLSIGLVLNYMERFFIVLPSVPGLRLGLSNIVILLGFFFFTRREVGLLLFARILLSSLFMLSFSGFFYSLIGGILSYWAMALSFPFQSRHFSIIGVSLLGAFFHNTGQMWVLAYFLKSLDIALAYYPLLIWSGIFSGLFTGFIALKMSTPLKAMSWLKE